MAKAQLIDLHDPNHNQILSEILLKGGIVGSIWGHHLYFLACNAYNKKAVWKMNKLKNRPKDKVFASPGSIEEAEEFADIKRCKGLNNAAKKMNMKPLEYLEFLYKKFPLGVELYANASAPESVTFATENGKTIWIAGHLRDKYYKKFLETVRNLRREGKEIVFAATSFNLGGEDTLTIKDYDKAIEDFGDKIDAISVHPRREGLRRLNFTTSCSAVSFIHSNPKLLRLGATPVKTLRRYIPDLEIPDLVSSTRKTHKS